MKAKNNKENKENSKTKEKKYKPIKRNYKRDFINILQKKIKIDLHNN